MGVFIAIALAIAFALALLLPQDAMVGNTQAGAVVAQAAFGLIAITLAASLIPRYRGRLSAAARDALIWVGLAMLFVGLYAYRDVFAPAYERVLAEFSPGMAITTAPGVAEIAKRSDGHFIIRMKANGVDIPFLFDTGATTVTLRAEDARKIGIDVSALNFTEVISTANGVARAAEARIDSLSVGTITQTRVRALVARQGALSESLLGQNFMEGLAGYGAENGRLVLRGK